MKLLLLSTLLGLLLLATSAIGQEEVTTTLAPPASSEAPKESPTEAPAVAETTTVPVDATKTDAPAEPAATEEKPKTEEKKDETGDKAGEAKQPGELETAGQGPPQEPPKFVFVTQHFRDPMTGVVYSRQVPLIPSTYLRPLPSQSDVRQQQQPTVPQQEPSAAAGQQQPSFDPLGQYSEQQKKRQFYQDMIMTQLTRFEKEIEPMLESEQNMTQKNDMEELLSTVTDLKHKLENHQIFNISEIMNNWKQGKLADGMSEPQQPNLSEPPRGPPAGVFSTPPQVAYSRQPQMTLRTVILVPQTRHQQQPQQQPPMQPQYQPQYNPYAAMTRQVPVIHIRRSPYQAANMFASVPDSGRQTEGAEPQQAGTGSEGEYSNTNDIYGY